MKPKNEPSAQDGSFLFNVLNSHRYLINAYI